MSQITRQDIIDDDALQAPKLLGDSFQSLLESINQIISATRQHVDNLNQMGTSSSRVREETEKLTEEQKLLSNIQNQIAKEVAKQSEEYQAQARVLAELKQQAKEKQALGDKEAASINQQNASITQLNAALNANRQAYANLRNEQERNSAEGQRLLKTIQDQDKSLKNLHSSMGQNQLRVGAYRSELQELLEKYGAVSETSEMAASKIGLFGRLGQAALSPLGLTIGAIAVAVGITKASLDVFYEDSIQGADELNSKFKTFPAILEVIKDGMFSLGKATSGFLQFVQDGFKSYLATLPGGIALLTQVEIKEQKLASAAELQNEIRKEEIRNTVAFAKIELERTEELYKARDKANQPLHARYEAILKAKALSREDENERLAALNNEILLQQKLISVNTTKNVVGMSSSQILAQSNELGRVNYEQVEKLAQLEKARLDLQSQKNLAARRNQSLEASLVDEEMNHLREREKLDRETFNESMMEKVRADKQANDLILQNQYVLARDKVKLVEQNIANEGVLNDFEKSKAIYDLKEKYATQVQLDEETHKKINEEAKGDLVKRAQLEIDAINESLKRNENYQKAKQQIENQYREKENEIVRKGNNDISKLDIEAKKFTLENVKEISGETLSTTVELLNEEFRAEQENSARKFELFREDMQREIALAGNNNTAKIQLSQQLAAEEKKHQREQIELRRKQAIFDKAAALIDVGVKEALAISQLLVLMANPVTAPYATAMLPKLVAMFTLQEAAIAAKPIPQYAKGTDNHPGGLAVVGEEGHELVRYPHGGLSITPASSTLMNLPAGSEVFTNKETMLLMAMAGFNSFDFKKQDSGVDRKILRELKQLNKKSDQKNSLSPDYAKTASAVYEFRKESDNYTRKTRSLWMGQNFN